ncbi:hypothetical protein GOBAR_DD25157 [Gossypium barbadense]|nr:hypothetical protein GOBAR_DD25157 [Gossypium barbadense]
MGSYALFLIALFLCKFLAVAILDPLDFLALQSIRKSLHDLPGSNFFASWDFTSDPCNFAGVYCDSDKVIALNLGDPRAGSPGLTGRIDPAIGKLSALAELSIVPGRIYGSLPQSISQLKDLRFLAISRNFISGDIPATLGQLRSLKTLDLSYNQLTGEIPRSIGTLPELTNVILCHNHLSGSVPPFLSQVLTRASIPARPVKLPRLEFEPVHRSHPQPAVLIPHYEPPVGKKLNLYLNNNRFNGQIPASFVDRLLSGSIQILYLQHNYLTGIEIKPTAEIPVSSSLCLQYNCMVPPVQTPCPLKAGNEKTRPTAQCNEWKG